MASPDFTELTFGFAFLREFEQNCVLCGFPKAPDFISQRVEAKKGYDVEITLANATPVFLQFKRSKVMVGSKANEIKDRHFTAPVYRMELHQKGQYRQHKALQKLKKEGNAVFYVTSQICSSKEFANAYSTAAIVSQASALFSPEEINLPNNTKKHYVSFKSDEDYGYVFSSEPNRFKRKFITADSWLKHLLERPQSAEDNLESLKKAVEYLEGELPFGRPILKMIEERDEERDEERGEERDKERDIIVQASILAYFQLDTILTFVKPKK